VLCSVVLPKVAYLCRLMVVSDEDPAFDFRFKTAPTNDLDARPENCNMSWLKLSTDPRLKCFKCLPKTQRDAVWTELQNLISNAESQQLKEGDRSTPEPPRKLRRLRSLSDSDEDETPEQSQASLAVCHYKSESETDDDACPI